MSGAIRETKRKVTNFTLSWFSGRVSRMIAAYVGENKIFQDLYFNGEIAVELTPMGTIAQRLRAGGAGKFLSTL